MSNLRVLVVDLNNFSRYPTISVGLLTALLRRAGIGVQVFSPFSKGVEGMIREAPRRPWGYLDLCIRYRTAVSRSRVLRRARRGIAWWNSSQLARERKRVLRDFDRVLNGEYDVVLVSTYLTYYPHCRDIGRICRDRGIPLILGSAYFSSKDVVREWVGLEGVSCLVGGEVEQHLVELVEAVVHGRALEGVPGVWTRDGGSTAPPLRDLDSIPFPDYSDFPWDRYPNRIVPLVTGRGCGWGACSFCSDVIMAAARTYRSRSPEAVLSEARFQAERHDTNLLVFTDLKLNSNRRVWEALTSRLQSEVPGSKWIGAVHIGTNGDGLSRQDLHAAREAGAVRLTTGLESGSQRILDSMAKGTNLDRTSAFLEDASSAGISVRATVIVGYPGEMAADVEATTRFLDSHADCIERVRLNRLSIMTGSRLLRQLDSGERRPDGLEQLEHRHRFGFVDHEYDQNRNRAYRRAIYRLLRTVEGINRRPIRGAARPFEGVL